MFRYIATLAVLIACRSAFAADTFDTSTNILTVPQVQIGQTLYNNVQVKLNNITVVSVGSTSPVSSGNVAATCSASNFSTASYNAITVGMTVAQVNQVMGCAYDTSSTERTAEFIAYKWDDIPARGLQFIQVFFDTSGSVVTAYGTQYKLAGGF
jgi:hypothetical protein